MLQEARAENVDFAIEHTNSLRVDVGFVHTLRDAVALARRLDTGVCMELNACWAERALATTIRILGEIVAAGYSGFFELELIGDTIAAEGYAAAIPRAVAALDALLHRLGV